MNRPLYALVLSIIGLLLLSIFVSDHSVQGSQPDSAHSFAPIAAEPSPIALPPNPDASSAINETITAVPASCTGSNSPFTCTIVAAATWQQTPLTLQAGAPFSILYINGNWTVDYRSFSYVGPDGYAPDIDGQITPGCKVDPTSTYARLLGQIGNGPIFSVGSGLTFTANASGQLSLRINDHDSCLTDNDGSLVLKLQYGILYSLISGRVTNANGQPLPNITIVTTDGDSTTTQTDGSYSFGDQAPGSHTIVPSQSGYVFSPSERTVTAPPDATGVNFTGTAISFSCNQVTELPTSECEGLVAFYNSTNGPNWKNRDGWVVTLTPCSWFGVSCIDNHLFLLNLPNNNLVGTLPSQIDKLGFIDGLYLNNNQLSGAIPAAIGKLTLLDVYLSNNQLSGNIPPELGNYPALHYLHLDNNQFSGSIPEQLVNLNGLISLNLSGNRLSGTIPTQFGNLSNMVALHVENNPSMSGGLPSSMTNLSKLSTFWFHNTGLCEPSDNTFQTWISRIANLSRTGLLCAAPPSAEFDAWPQSGPAPLTVSMHIVSTANLSNCVWEYGDGQTGNSCTDYHDHIYTSAGTYTVKLTVSGSGGSATKTRNNYITVSAMPGNKPPVAYDQSVTTTQNTPVTIRIRASDPDNDPITYIIVSNPNHGGLSGTFRDLIYTPASGFNGADSFTFNANDGKADSNIATVNITVVPQTVCYTLTTAVNPTNGGTVSITPAPNCQGNKYTQGTTVLLSATANPTYSFSQWSGSANGNMNPLPVVINGDKNIIANFILTSATNTPVPTATTLPQTATPVPPTVTTAPPTDTPLPTPNADWIREQVNDLIGYDISLALDSSGNPHAIYNGGIFEHLRYIYRAANKWQVELVDGAQGAGSSTSIALDASEAPHIAYQQGGLDTSANLKYAKRTQNGWEITTLDENLGKGGINSSLILDKAGKSHIVYHAVQGDSGFKYARQVDNNQWEITFIDRQGAGGSLALDSVGKVHVAYSIPGGIRYASQTANGWISQTIDSNVGSSISLALDKNDNPHISFTNVQNKKLQYAYRTGSEWVIETLNDEGPYAPTNLILDSTGNPHIAYQVNYLIKYTHKTPKGWVYEIPSGTSYSAYSLEIGFALDGADNPHLLIQDHRLTYLYRFGQGNNSISGRVINSNKDAVVGINIMLSGPTSASAITDHTGNYSFLGLTDGNYTITPSNPDYTFSPPSRTIGVPGDAFDQDFVATSTRVNPLPVVLVHDWNKDYSSWNTYVRNFLPSIGLTGYEADLNTGLGPNGPLSIDENARILRYHIAWVKGKTGAKQVNIVAHGVGGLIARRYIAKYMDTYSPDVNQLIMLGTPNAGSKTADALELARIPLWLAGKLGFPAPWPSAKEWTTKFVQQFNRDNPPPPTVRFYAIAGNYYCQIGLPPFNPLEDDPDDVIVSRNSVFAIAEHGRWTYPNQNESSCSGDHRGMITDNTGDGGETIFNRYVSPLLQGVMPIPSPEPQTSIASQINAAQMGQEQAEEGSLQFVDVQTGILQFGGRLEVTQATESGSNTSFIVVGPAHQMVVSLRDPNGRVITPDTSDPGVQYMQMNAEFTPMVSFTISNPVPGIWTTVIQANSQTPISGVVVAAVESLISDLRLVLPTTASVPRIFQRVEVTAQLQKGITRLVDANIKTQLIFPDGTVTSIMLLDDGVHGDGGAKDGLYGYQFTPITPGVYSAFITAEGINDSRLFKRSAVWAIQVDGSQVFLPMVLR